MVATGKDENSEMAYYGMTKDIDQDGTREVNGVRTLCKTFNRIDSSFNEACEPMKKTFFTQVIHKLNQERINDKQKK